MHGPTRIFWANLRPFSLQWLALPFCAAVPPAPAGTLLLEDRPARGAQKAEGAVRAGRRLIGGFGLPEGERERLRKQLLCECC